MANKTSVVMVVTSSAQIDASHPTGLWLEEFAVPYLEFRAAGFSVTAASVKGGKAPVDPRSNPTPQQARVWADAIQALERTEALTGFDASTYDAVFLPGGHGTMFDLPENAALQKLLNEFAQSNKVIAAVCHGPAGFVGAKGADGKPLVAGKTMTGFSNSEERAAQMDGLMPFLLETKLRDLGANVVVKPDWTDHVQRDGNLITGQNPQSSRSAALAVIEAVRARRRA